MLLDVLSKSSSLTFLLPTNHLLPGMTHAIAAPVPKHLSPIPYSSQRSHETFVVVVFLEDCKKSWQMISSAVDYQMANKMPKAWKNQTWIALQRILFVWFPKRCNSLVVLPTTNPLVVTQQMERFDQYFAMNYLGKRVVVTFQVLCRRDLSLLLWVLLF